MDEIGSALEKLRAFNRMVCGDARLKAILVDGEHDVLQWEQFRLFTRFRDHLKKKSGKAFTTPAEAGAHASKVSRGFGLLLGALTGLILTFIAAVSARLRGARVLVFSIDEISAGGRRDFRLEGLYRALEARGTTYAEVLHTELHPTLLRHFAKRRKAVIYHEALDAIAALRTSLDGTKRRAKDAAAAASCEGFPEDEKPVVRAAITQLVELEARHRCRIRSYRFLLRLMGTRVVLSIDDTRHYHDLVAAAHAVGIPFHAFQHGLFTSVHVAWLDDGCGPRDRKERPDTLVVWSEYWKRELLRLGTYFDERQLVIGGSPKLASAYAAAPPEPSASFGILVPYESGAPKEEVSAYLRRFLEDPSAVIYFKVRPDRDVDAQLSEYGMTRSDRFIVVQDGWEAQLPKIRAVAGVYSTFLYDALVHLRPVVILETSRTSGQAMVTNGFASSLRRGEGLARLKEISEKDAPLLEGRARDYLGGGIKLEETLARLLPRDARS